MIEAGSIPGWGTKIPQAFQCGQKKKKKREREKEKKVEDKAWGPSPFGGGHGDGSTGEEERWEKGSVPSWRPREGRDSGRRVGSKVPER